MLTSGSLKRGLNFGRITAIVFFLVCMTIQTACSDPASTFGFLEKDTLYDITTANPDFGRKLYKYLGAADGEWRKFESRVVVRDINGTTIEREKQVIWINTAQVIAIAQSGVVITKP